MWTAGWVQPDDRLIMVTSDHPWVMALRPSSTYQQLLPLWCVPLELWTAGWMEPCDKWMVTIIHLSEAPYPGVGRSWLVNVCLYSQFHSCSSCLSCLGLASLHNVVRCCLADLSTNHNAVLICSILMRWRWGDGQIYVSRRVLRVVQNLISKAKVFPSWTLST